MTGAGTHKPSFWLAVASLWMLTGFFSVTCSSGDPPFSPPNDAPVAGDSNITVVVGIQFLGFLQASDPNGDRLTYRIVSVPTQGTVEITNSLTGEYRYTGQSTGTDQFRFRASDLTSSSNTATVTVTIDPAPVAVNTVQ